MKDGGWLLWAWVGIYALASALGLIFTRSLSFGDQPGSKIPWYFIRQDYILGIVMGIGGLACLLLGLAFLKRYRSNARILIAQSVIWFSVPAWKAFVIALRSDHVLSPALARTSWPTFEAYYGDPLIGGALDIFLFVAMVAVVIVLARMILERRRAARTAQGA